MPTYEYACRDCGQHLEVVQSFKDAPLTTCGTCNGALRKVFSAAGIIFKGSGYYVTDTRKQDAAATSTKSGNDGKGTGEGASSDSGKDSSTAGKTSSEGAKTSSDTSKTGGAAESA